MLDEATFASLTATHRRELHVHSYRMLGNFDAAEDALQEALLRAWRGRASFDGGPGARAWLYRIVTTTCLDMLRKAGREAVPAESIADLAWLTPYPDVLLDEAGPEDLAVRRETIELAYLAVIQLLPARQRAVLLLRDVLGYSAAETAAALDMSVAAANSALQRARATLAERLPERDASWSTDGLTEADRDLLAAFIDAHQRQDPVASLALVREDVRISMPPQPVYFTGREKMVELMAVAFDRAQFGEWRLLPTAANRMPAAASYLLRNGAPEWIAYKLDVIRVAGGRIAETTTFDHSLFPAFGLPLTLPLSLLRRA